MPRKGTRKEPKKHKSTYSIPRELYMKAFGEIKQIRNEDDEQIQSKCHQNIYEKFKGIEVPTCKGNFLEAAKQALEDRNFTTLYLIISKALGLRDSVLTQQIFEYFYTGLSHDEKILEADRESLLKIFLTTVKRIDENVYKEYLKNIHSFQISSEEHCDPVKIENK